MSSEHVLDEAATEALESLEKQHDHVAFYVNSSEASYHLDLNNQLVGPNPLRYLVLKLQGNHTLRSVCLDNNAVYFKPDATFALARLISSMPSLEKLSANNCGIGKVREDWNDVERLSEFHSPDQYSGVRALADAISLHVALANVELRDNGLDTKSTAILAEGFSECIGLSRIDLRGNEIGIRGGTCFILFTFFYLIFLTLSFDLLIYPTSISYFETTPL